MAGKLIPGNNGDRVHAANDVPGAENQTTNMDVYGQLRLLG